MHGWVAVDEINDLFAFDSLTVLVLECRDNLLGTRVDHVDGRTAFASTGDMVDTRTKEIVATLEDEHGQAVESEKVVEIGFVNGKPARASDQFGKGAKR